MNKTWQVITVHYNYGHYLANKSKFKNHDKVFYFFPSNS